MKGTFIAGQTLLTHGLSGCPEEAIGHGRSRPEPNRVNISGFPNFLAKGLGNT